MATKTFEIKNNNVNGVRFISILFVPMYAGRSHIENVINTRKNSEHIFRYDVVIEQNIFNITFYKLDIIYDKELHYSCVSIDATSNIAYCERGSSSNITALINEAIDIIYKNAGAMLHVYNMLIDMEDEISKIILNKINTKEENN